LKRGDKSKNEFLHKMNLALVGEGENQGAEKRSIAWLKAATLLVL
jgi:hypothetical protein